MKAACHEILECGGRAHLFLILIAWANATVMAQFRLSAWISKTKQMGGDTALDFSCFNPASGNARPRQSGSDLAGLRCGAEWCA